MSLGPDESTIPAPDEDGDGGGSGPGSEPELVIGPEAVAEPGLVECWRCGKHVPPSARCPICRAALGEASPPGEAAAVESLPVAARPMGRPATAGGPVDHGHVATRLMIAYLGFLATSVAYALYAHMTGSDVEADPCDMRPTLLLEGVDTALVVAALFWVPRRPRPPAISARRRLAGWAGGAALMAVALPINFAYHRWLVETLGLTGIEDTFLSGCGWTPAVVAAVCLQPAIVEELFFRHLVLDSLWASAGRHTAVVVSSVMFGLAHLGNPLGMPLLIVLGLALGYARVWSRSLALPMILHFAHNAAVLYFESQGS